MRGKNALHHFGGAPLLLNIGNLKAAVLKADWFDPHINPKLAEFCIFPLQACSRKLPLNRLDELINAALAEQRDRLYSGAAHQV